MKKRGSRQIESVTIYSAGANGPEAKVVAKVLDLAACQKRRNPQRFHAEGLGVCVGWLRGQDLNL